MTELNNMTEEELIARWEKLQQDAQKAREKALNAKNAEARAKAKAREKQIQKLLKAANKSLRIVQGTVDKVGSEEIQSTLDALTPDTSTKSKSGKKSKALTMPKFKNFKRGRVVKKKKRKAKKTTSYNY